jgi:hypothetical protein
MTGPGEDPWVSQLDLEVELTAQRNHQNPSDRVVSDCRREVDEVLRSVNCSHVLPLSAESGAAGRVLKPTGVFLYLTFGRQFIYFFIYVKIRLHIYTDDVTRATFSQTAPPTPGLVTRS